MFPINKILASEQFKNSQILAGEAGINNDVSYINMLYNTDGYQYIKKGALVIIAGSGWLRKKEDRLALLRKLHSMEISGAGTYLSDYGGDFPADMKELADELGLPIISIDGEFSCEKVLDYFSNSLYIKLFDKFVRVDTIQKEFFECYKSKKAECIASKLWRFAGKDVYFQANGIRYHFGKKTDMTALLAHRDDWEIAPFLPPNIPEDSRLKSYSLKDESGTTIWLGYEFGKSEDAKVCFWILADKDKLLDQQSIMLFEYAWQALSLEISRKTYDLIQRHEKTLFNLLNTEYKNDEEARQELLKSGYQPADSYAVLLLPGNSTNDDFLSIQSDVDSLLFKEKASGSVLLMGNYEDQFILLLTANSKLSSAMDMLVPTLNTYLSAKGKPRGGLGGWTELSQLASSYRQATASLFWSEKQQKRAVFPYSELGYLQLICRDEALIDIQSFVDTYLGPIKDHDRKNRSDLYQTLRIHVTDHVWTYSRTAKALFTSLNTIRYRIQQIEKLTGLDLNDWMTRLNVELALALDQFLEK
jgi:purine catabolism regulator